MMTAGAPVTLAVSNTAYQLSAVHKLVKTIRIQPKATNTGIMSIGDSTLAAATPLGIAAQLPAPAATEIQSYELTEVDAPNGIDVFNFWVSSTVGGDIALWSYNEQ